MTVQADGKFRKVRIKALVKKDGSKDASFKTADAFCEDSLNHYEYVKKHYRPQSRLCNEDTMTKDKTRVHFQTGATSMRLGLLGLAVCMLLFMFGCGKTESEDSEGGNDSKVGASSQDSNSLIAPQADDIISPKVDAGAKTTVKLLDPGAQPRTALRYKFQANRTEKMVTETSMAMTMEIGDQKQPETQVPDTRMTMTIHSKEVSPEGDLHYEFELEKVEVLPKPGANPAIVNAMKQQTSSMQGLSGSATVTSRGFTKDTEIKPPPGIDPQIRQSMDQMKQSMNQMSAPLPEEPVGRGARWQVTMPVETLAMKFTQIATYTLSEIQGDKVKFDVTIKQSAPPQEISSPGAAPDVKVSLESLKTSGKGTVELQITKLVPTSNINMTTTNVISANNQNIKTTMRIGMKIHPGN
jgi:hypothetical protein